MTKLVVREIVVFLLASLILTGIAILFRAKDEEKNAATARNEGNRIASMWDNMDAGLVESVQWYLEDGGGTSPLDKIVGQMKDIVGDGQVLDSLLRLKLLQWGTIQDVNDRTGVIQDPTDKDILSKINDPTLGQRYSVFLPRFSSFMELQILFSITELSDKLQHKQSPLPEFDSQIRSIRDEYIAMAAQEPESVTHGAFKPWEIIPYIGFAVFFLSTLVTIFSRFLARLITASHLQDLIAGQDGLNGFKLKVLPYLFAVPAFVLASLFAGTAFIQPVVMKLVVVIFVMVVASGLSFELVLKYLEQGRQEYAKPYARYLALSKRGRSKTGLFGLMKAIQIPRRGERLRQSKSILPFLLTGADYQLNDHIRRRMSVIVDSYTLAGLILSFTLWDTKPDLVNMLTGAAGSYGASVNTVYMIEAILLGILASKLLFIVSEARQFPQK